MHRKEEEVGGGEEKEEEEEATLLRQPMILAQQCSVGLCVLFALCLFDACRLCIPEGHCYGSSSHLPVKLSQQGACHTSPSAR